MKSLSSITLFVLSALFLGASHAGSYQSGGYPSGYAYYPGSQPPPVQVYVVTGAQKLGHQLPYAVGVRPVQFTYDNGGNISGPGHQQQQRPERRYEQRLPRGHEQRFQKPPHQQRHPTMQQRYPAPQQGNSRAGENQFGSGNSQMPRPPQMNQPGPAQGRDQGYRAPQQRYSR